MPNFHVWIVHWEEKGREFSVFIVAYVAGWMITSPFLAKCFGSIIGPFGNPVSMIKMCLFSLQNYKQKSIHLFLLLLNMFKSLHSVSSFHDSDLLIPFMINFECLYLD